MNNLLSIATVFNMPGNGQRYTEELLTLFNQAKVAGFDAVDINFADAAREGFPLASEGWQAWVDTIGEALQRIGLKTPQAHSLVYRSVDSTNPAFPNRPWFEERIRRCIHAAASLGISWLVLHPTDFVEDAYYDSKKNHRHNLNYWQPFLEDASKKNLGIAFENLYPSGQKLNRFCSHYAELIDLVDCYGDKKIGICWDTGHALCAQQDQGRALRAIGSRLKATHLHDNRGATRFDEHLLPYHGVNDWPAITSALREIDYSGALSLEVKYEKDTPPLPLHVPLMQYVHSVGRFLKAEVQQGA